MLSHAYYSNLIAKTEDEKTEAKRYAVLGGTALATGLGVLGKEGWDSKYTIQSNNYAAFKTKYDGGKEGNPKKYFEQKIYWLSKERKNVWTWNPLGRVKKKILDDLISEAENEKKAYENVERYNNDIEMQDLKKQLLAQ